MRPFAVVTAATRFDVASIAGEISPLGLDCRHTRLHRGLLTLPRHCYSCREQRNYRRQPGEARTAVRDVDIIERRKERHHEGRQ